MFDDSYPDILVSKGFERIGQLSFRFSLELWWHPQRHVQLLVVPLGQAMLVKGHATYYLSSRQDDGNTWMRDVEAFHQYLENHFPELHLAFSFFRDVPAELASREASRLAGALGASTTVSSVEAISNVQRQLEAAQHRNASVARMLQLSSARNDLLAHHVQRQAQQNAPTRQLAEKLRSQREHLQLVGQFQREFLRRGSAAVLTFKIDSNQHMVVQDSDRDGNMDTQTQLNLGDAVDAIMAELNDYDRYHIRQKLNGGRLKINVQRSTEPALSWIELWCGGALSPTQVQQINAQGLVAVQLAAATAERCVVTPDETISINGSSRQPPQHLAAHVASAMLGRLDVGRGDAVTQDPDSGKLRLEIGLLSDERPASLPLKALGHILVSGTTGSGKSVAARVLAEEVSKHPSMRLLVIDPRGQFAGSLLPEDRPMMLQHYPRFGMKTADARAIDARYIASGMDASLQMPAPLSKLADGRWIVSLKSLDDEQRCNTAADILYAAFNHFVGSESESPRLFILIDEAQLFTKRRTGRDASEAANRCELLLDQIAREGRKHGIVLCLVSQTMKSFGHNLAVLRQMASTKIFFRNSDLELDYAAEILPDPKVLVNLPTGMAVIHNALTGLLSVQFRPPRSLTAEVPQTRLSSLLNANSGRLGTPISSEAAALLGTIERFNSESSAPPNLSQLGRLANVSSRRKLLALVAELEAKGKVRTSHLPERGKPRVVVRVQS